MDDKKYFTKILNKKIDNEMLVVVQLKSKKYISYYDLNKFKPMDLPRFIRLCDNWWVNEPTIPVSLYYKDIFDQFEYALDCLGYNEYECVGGFEGVSLKNMSEKRIKRRVINIENR